MNSLSAQPPVSEISNNATYKQAVRKEGGGTTERLGFVLLMSRCSCQDDRMSWVWRKWALEFGGLGRFPAFLGFRAVEEQPACGVHCKASNKSCSAAHDEKVSWGVYDNRGPLKWTPDSLRIRTPRRFRLISEAPLVRPRKPCGNRRAKGRCFC